VALGIHKRSTITYLWADAPWKVSVFRRCDIVRPQNRDPALLSVESLAGRRLGWSGSYPKDERRMKTTRTMTTISSRPSVLTGDVAATRAAYDLPGRR
jgi:hypothetical protein